MSTSPSLRCTAFSGSYRIASGELRHVALKAKQAFDGHPERPVLVFDDADARPLELPLELPAAGGLYQFSNVTYRGVQLGKVTSVGLTPTGAKATLSLSTSPKVPADLTAQVLSVSAVGEQYVDLQPKTDSPPYLHDGSAATLEAAIAAHFTLPTRPTPAETRALIAFLDTLTDTRFATDARFSLPKPASCRAG